MNDPMDWMQWTADFDQRYPVIESEGDNRGPAIDEIIKLCGAGRPGDPYCAIGVNAAFEAVGIPGTRSAAARSFEWDGGKHFVKLAGPAYGAVTVFWRGAPNKGTGHVGFYLGETANHIYTYGFNQGDDLNESPFPKRGKSFGLVGYYWPASIPLPEIGALEYDPNASTEEVSAT